MQENKTHPLKYSKLY